MHTPLLGLIAATHTPFDASGNLQLTTVEDQCHKLLRDGIKTVFIGGTTGECTSLTIEERLALADRWFEVAKKQPMDIVVHVGSNCIDDSCRLASHAQSRGARAVAAFAPSYFKPPHCEALVQCMQRIAAVCDTTAFYYYDIPSWTGVSISMPDFLKMAHTRIPNLAGLKFTNHDLVAYQLCRQVEHGKFDILFGMDEISMAALAYGCTGAVGSTYNFAGGIFHRLWDAWQQQDLETTRREQLRSIRLVQILASRGYMASAKHLMKMRGVDVGPPRLPVPPLSVAQQESLESDLATEFADLL